MTNTHDGNGNLKDDGTYLFEYNYRSLLCRVKLKSDNSTVATYKHDALGRRVEKEVGSPRERYIYSGYETVSVYDSTNTWVRDFVYGEGIDEVLMLRQADVLDFDGDTDTSEVTRHFYHRNALGSVMEITDMNEAVAVSYRYDPYGAVTITVGGTPQSSDPLGNPWMFTGRMLDEETGLYYYRARHYSPVTGRFLQRDPLGYGPGANLYRYASASPVTRRDPMGTDDAAKPPTKLEAAETAQRQAGADYDAIREMMQVETENAVWIQEALYRRGEDGTEPGTTSAEMRAGKTLEEMLQAAREAINKLREAEGEAEAKLREIAKEIARLKRESRERAPRILTYPEYYSPLPDFPFDGRLPPFGFGKRC